MPPKRIRPTKVCACTVYGCRAGPGGTTTVSHSKFYHQLRVQKEADAMTRFETHADAARAASRAEARAAPSEEAVEGQGEAALVGDGAVCRATGEAEDLDRFVGDYGGGYDDGVSSPSAHSRSSAMAALPALRLYTSNASPFCLKVMMLAHELGLAQHVELDYSVKPMPTLTSTPHSHLAPHGKIPALVVTTSGPSSRETTLFGSENICAYLDELAGGKALPPHGSLARFEVLTTEALASAIKDAALALRYERIERPQELLWPQWVVGQLSKITRSIPVLAKRNLPDPTAEVLGLDGIATAIALWYVDRRAADSNWRELEGGKELNSWYERVRERPSWKATPFVK